LLPQEDTNGNQQNGLEYVVLISVQIITKTINYIYPHKGDKLLAGSVPNPKCGIEVAHKASPLQGEEIQVQGVQLMDRQENYVEKASHNHPQPLPILTSQIPQIVSNYVNQSTTIQESHPQKSISLFVFLFGFPLIDAL